MATMRNDYYLSELCDVFEVSRSGYYAWSKNPVSERKRQDQELLNEIQIMRKQKYVRAYGSPRLTTRLRAKGYRCSPRRVVRIMNEHGITASPPKAWKPQTTKQNPKSKASPNLLKERSPSAPRETLVGDITYVHTKEKTLYLSVIMDLFTRQILGWKLSDHMESSLVKGSLEEAKMKQGFTSETLFHSDRGSQYSSTMVREYLKENQLTQSMSAKGYCYDNATMESFFATLKKESFPPKHTFENPTHARREIFSYIEGFYNTQRIHTSLNNLSPDQFYNLHLN